jgi:GPH family glycoside/pentoside/hexuronide:cation symporter
VALFSFTGFSSPTAAAVTVGAMFFVASTAFSAFSVPYLALASELSPDPYVRTKILSFRLVFAVLGVVVSVGVAQPIVQALGGGPGAWRVMALTLGGLALVSMLATPLGLRGRVAPDASGGLSGGWGAGLRAAWRNKPYLTIIVTQFIQATAMACGYTVVGFVFIYVVGKVNLLLPFILLMAMGTFASQPLWLAMSRRLGKPATFAIATAGWAVVTVSWFWVQPGGEPFMTLPLTGTLGTQEALVILRGIGIGVTNGGFVLMIFAMLTDAINEGRQIDDQVDEGLLSGIFTAVEKLGFACGPLIAGVTLSLSGFQSSVTGIATQSPQAVRGIVMAFSAVPATLVVASLVYFLLARRRAAS